MTNALRTARATLVSLALTSCGGSEPPAHPPKIEAIRPTAETKPPPATSDSKQSLKP